MFIVYHLYGKNSEPHSLTDYAKRVTQKILSRADTFASIIISTYSHFYTATQELLYCDRPQWPQDICLRHYNSPEVLAESRPIPSFSFRPPLFFHLWILYTMLSQWIKIKKIKHCSPNATLPANRPAEAHNLFNHVQNSTSSHHWFHFRKVIAVFSNGCVYSFWNTNTLFLEHILFNVALTFLVQ